MRDFNDVTMQVIRANSDSPWRERLTRLWMLDLVRIVAVPDHDYTLQDLKGDSFKPECNPSVSEFNLLYEEVEFEKRVLSEGVNGIVAEVKKSDGWEHVDSVYGFVGQTYLNSGYDADLASSLAELEDT